MQYEVFTMRDCDKCHNLVDRLKQENAEFTEYSLTDGRRKDRIQSKKRLTEYNNSVGLNKIEGMIDIPVLVAYENKPEEITPEAVKIYQGKEAMAGLEKCLSTH